MQFDTRSRLLGGVAAAALVAVVGGQPAAAGDASSWTGFYIGGHFGGAQSDWDGRFVPTSSYDTGDFVADFDDRLGETGIAGGLLAGYNYVTPYRAGQWGSFLVGGEVDVSALGGLSAGSEANAFPATCGSSSTNGVCTEKIDVVGSLRGRLGLVLDPIPIHLYSTVGAAYSNAAAHVAEEPSSDGRNFDFNDVGLAWGFGGEWMAAPHLVVGAEWIRYQFNEERDFTLSSGDTDRPNEFLEFNNIDTFRVRVTYKF